MPNFDRTAGGLHVAMVLRIFSTSGGLELYSHKLIEGLLKKGARITVFCQQFATDLEHENLSVVRFEQPLKRMAKYKRLRFDHDAATEAVAGQRREFDLVHSQHLGMWGADVVTFHNNTVDRVCEVGLQWERALNSLKSSLSPGYRLRREYDELLCNNARCLIFPSHVMQADYYSAFPSLQEQEKPYVVAYPGCTAAADDNLLVSRPVRGPGSPFTFLFVGKGFRKKGLDVLLGACQQVARINPNFKLLIAGLSEKPVDKLRLKLLNLEDQVQYLGFQSDLSRVFASADASVVPSRIEAFGMAVLQSMRHSLIPIVSRRCGVSEILDHKKNALILEDETNVDELAQLLLFAMSDSQQTAAIRENARTTAESLQWEHTVSETLRAYDIALTSQKQLQAALQ